MGVLQELPPRGHYLAHEVGRLAGVSGYKIGQWARRGYISASQSSAIPHVYSYQDIAEAMLVHELENAHVQHDEILETVEQIRQRSGASWPLTSAARLSVTLPGIRRRTGKKVAALMIFENGRYIRPGKSWDEGVLDIQIVNIRADLRRGGWAARELADLEHIEVDPERLSGRPTIRGRRLPVEDVALLAQEPGGVEELHDGYSLSDDEIADAVRWWKTVRKYEDA